MLLRNLFESFEHLHWKLYSVTFLKMLIVSQYLTVLLYYLTQTLSSNGEIRPITVDAHCSPGEFEYQHRSDRVLISSVAFSVLEIRPHKVSSVWCRPDHTILCHSQPCQFVRVHAPAAYGGNMLSGELVSWPGLPSPGTDGDSLGPEEQLCCSRYSARSGLVLLPWLFLSAWWPLFLQRLFTCQDSSVCRWTLI